MYPLRACCKSPPLPIQKTEVVVILSELSLERLFLVTIPLGLSCYPFLSHAQLLMLCIPFGLYCLCPGAPVSGLPGINLRCTEIVWEVTLSWLLNNSMFGDLLVGLDGQINESQLLPQLLGNE